MLNPSNSKNGWNKQKSVNTYYYYYYYLWSIDANDVLMLTNGINT